MDATTSGALKYKKSSIPEKAFLILSPTFLDKAGLSCLRSPAGIIVVFDNDAHSEINCNSAELYVPISSIIINPEAF